VEAWAPDNILDYCPKFLHVFLFQIQPELSNVGRDASKNNDHK